MYPHFVTQPSYLASKILYYGNRALTDYFSYANRASIPVRIVMYGGLVFAFLYSSSLWTPLLIGYIGYKALTNYYTKR